MMNNMQRCLHPEKYNIILDCYHRDDRNILLARTLVNQHRYAAVNPENFHDCAIISNRTDTTISRPFH